MHKRLVNRCTLSITLVPQGPILIKASDQGADPTKPDMEFVETYHNGDRTIYLPGSSLKGAIRAHAERICRSVGGETAPNRSDGIWANDPLENTKDYESKLKEATGAKAYKVSSFTDRLFGNTAIGSRLRIEDSYPDPKKPIVIEERNGVAIDRVFGSAKRGALFNYQVCTAGEFKTKIHLKNFSLAQLGLIGLVLRDLSEGWFGIGFAKSRGLGFMDVAYESVVIQYPTCTLKEGRLYQLGTDNNWDRKALLGVSEFLNFESDTGQKEYQKYGMTAEDRDETSPVAATEMSLGIGAEIDWPIEQVDDLFRRAVNKWQQLIPTGRSA